MARIVGVIPGGALSEASQSACAEGPNGNPPTEKSARQVSPQGAIEIQGGKARQSLPPLKSCVSWKTPISEGARTGNEK